MLPVYQRKVDMSQFIMPQQRPDYPLPPFRGVVSPPPAPPQTGNPLGLLTQAPPDDMQGGLLGTREGGNSNDEGFGTGGANNAANQESKGSISYGRASDYNNQIGKHAGRVGSVVGSLAGIGGLGTVAGLAGTGYDLNQVDQNLAAAQTPGLSTAQVVGSLANSVVGFVGNTPNELQDINIQNHWGPAGFDPMASYGYSAFSPFGNMGFADPIGGGEDGFGGWGGYGAPANTGPGADIEGEPGNWSDLEAAANEASAASNDPNNENGSAGGGSRGRGNDGYGDENDHDGYGDDMGGPDGGLRSGGLLGDDGDGKFEPIRKTLHENEAVLKPESVGLLGDALVMQLNNVASLSKSQRQKLAEDLSAQITRGKPSAKKTDFRASLLD